MKKSKLSIQEKLSSKSMQSSKKLSISEQNSMVIENFSDTDLMNLKRANFKLLSNLNIEFIEWSIDSFHFEYHIDNNYKKSACLKFLMKNQIKSPFYFIYKLTEDIFIEKLNFNYQWILYDYFITKWLKQNDILNQFSNYQAENALNKRNSIVISKKFQNDMTISDLECMENFIEKISYLLNFLYVLKRKTTGYSWAFLNVYENFPQKNCIIRNSLRQYKKEKLDYRKELALKLCQMPKKTPTETYIRKFKSRQSSLIHLINQQILEKNPDNKNIIFSQEISINDQEKNKEISIRRYSKENIIKQDSKELLRSNSKEKQGLLRNNSKELSVKRNSKEIMNSAMSIIEDIVVNNSPKNDQDDTHKNNLKNFICIPNDEKLLGSAKEISAKTNEVKRRSSVFNPKNSKKRVSLLNKKITFNEDKLDLSKNQPDIVSLENKMLNSNEKKELQNISENIASTHKRTMIKKLFTEDYDGLQRKEQNKQKNEKKEEIYNSINSNENSESCANDGKVGQQKKIFLNRAITLNMNMLMKNENLNMKNDELNKIITAPKKDTEDSSKNNESEIIIDSKIENFKWKYEHLKGIKDVSIFPNIKPEKNEFCLSYYFIFSTKYKFKFLSFIHKY